MPATATLTVTATTETIRRVLDLLDAETRGGSVVVTPPGGPPDDRLAAFARVLTPLGRRVVRVIAEAGQGGGVVIRRNLLALVASGEPLDLTELNGALGTVGVRWTRIVGTANPFLGRVDSALGDRVYGVDPPLAGRVLGALGAVERATNGRPPGGRLGRLEEAVRSLNRRFGGEKVAPAGAHNRATEPRRSPAAPEAAE